MNYIFINYIFINLQGTYNLKKEYLNILSNRKSKTRLNEINPSDRFVKKSLFKARFMKPVHAHGAPSPILRFSRIDVFLHTLHAHGAPSPILRFISIDVFLHTVSACTSKLGEKIEIIVYLSVSFFGGVYLGTVRFLAIQQEENKETN